MKLLRAPGVSRRKFEIELMSDVAHAFRAPDFELARSANLISQRIDFDFIHVCELAEAGAQPDSHEVFPFEVQAFACELAFTAKEVLAASIYFVAN